MTAMVAHSQTGRISSRSGVALSLILGAWALVLRGPFLHGLALDMDEALYVLAGRSWLSGGLPYRDVWDLKPPGLFALVALAQSLFGDTAFSARLPTALGIAATTVLLHRLLLRHVASPGTAFAAAAAYPLYTLVMGSIAAKAELMGAPFVVCGFLLACRLRNSAGSVALAPIFLGGLAFGCAFTIKQSFAFEAVAAIVLALWGRPPAQALRQLFAFVLGGALPAITFLGYFAWRGAGEDFLGGALLGALARTGSYPSLADGLGALAMNLKPILPLAATAMLVFVDRARLLDDRERAGARLAAAWLAASLAAVVVQRALYPHYLLVLVPPAIVLLGLELRIARDAAAMRLPKPALAFVLAMIAILWPAIWFARNADFEGLPTHVWVRAAAFMQDHGLAPGAPIYVVDAEMASYVASGASAPTRFVLPMHLMCPFDAPVDAEDEIRRIVRSRPEFVLFRYGSWIGCVLPERVRLVTDEMARGYAHAVTLGDAYAGVEIFCRNDRCAASLSETDPDARPPRPARANPIWRLAPHFGN